MPFLREVQGQVDHASSGLPRARRAIGNIDGGVVAIADPNQKGRFDSGGLRVDYAGGSMIDENLHLLGVRAAIACPVNPQLIPSVGANYASRKVDIVENGI